MKPLSLSVLKKYINAINKDKRKVLSLDAFSKVVGVYPDALAEQLSFFDPMLAMSVDYNVRDILPMMEKYVLEEESKKEKTVRRVVSKKDLLPYSSIQEFIYDRLTFDGIVDKSAELSDKDLKILKKLINEELGKRKKKK